MKSKLTAHWLKAGAPECTPAPTWKFLLCRHSPTPPSHRSQTAMHPIVKRGVGAERYPLRISAMGDAALLPTLPRYAPCCVVPIASVQQAHPHLQQHHGTGSTEAAAMPCSHPVVYLGRMGNRAGQRGAVPA